MLSLVQLIDFYAERRRAESPEVVYGAAWRTQGNGPWTVVWLQATGELVATQREEGEVVLIGVETDPQRLQATLTGWEQRVGELNGLAWLAECFARPTYAAGWYSDPWQPRGGRYRWWDGARWSYHTTPSGKRPREPPPAFPARAAAWTVIGVVVSVTLGGIAGRVLHHVVRSPTLANLALYVVTYSGIALTCVLASMRYGSGRLGVDFGWRFQLGDLLRGPLVFFLTALAGGIVMSPWLNSRSVTRGSEVLRYSETHRPLAATVMLVIVAVLAAPLIEELVFRGVLLRSLTAWIGVRSAVVVQALCFGLCHFAPGLGGFTIYWMAATALIGLGFGIAATRWRRLGPTIVAHAAMNAVHFINALSR
jgi:hypothetical protein